MSGPGLHRVFVFVFVLLLVEGIGCSDPSDEGRAPKRSTATQQQQALQYDQERAPKLPAVPHIGARPPAQWADRPRFSPAKEDPRALRCLPDGELGEWEGGNASKVTWLAAPKKLDRRASSARLAMASYPSGLSLAVVVDDDDHRPPAHVGAFGDSDHVVVELWPKSTGPRSRAAAKLHDRVRRELGVKLRFGTNRQLIAFQKPQESWREQMASATGTGRSGGYQLEARLPLAILTPLAGPMVTAVRYRVTIFDADSGPLSDRRKVIARPSLRFDGELTLKVPMAVPEAVQKRASVRTCMAAYPRGLWGYRNGWRCAVPYTERHIERDDTETGSSMRFGYARMPEPPVLQWLRERMVFINIPGANRGAAGLLDRRGKLLSVLPLGVVGSTDPGNVHTKDSDAVPLKLPDGTWAVAVTYAYPAETGHAGGRCAAGRQVYASIIAARGAPESTPHNPPPDPDPPPVLQEVFRVQVEDCDSSRAFEWRLSKDRRMIHVTDLVSPARAARTFTFKDGWYQASGN